MSTGENPQSLHRLPLYQQLQTLIFNYIADNKLRPGDPIPSEGELAERFGVGRNSVREAVKSLQVLGVLESRPGSGLFVREFSLDPIVETLPYAILVDYRDLDRILDVRRFLEVGMAEQVIAARTDAQIRRLREIVDSWQAELAKSKSAYPAALDRAFHEEFVSEVQNALLGKLLDMFWQVFNRARGEAELVAPRDPHMTFTYHVRLLRALESGDVEKLRDALAEHYRGIGPWVKPTNSSNKPNSTPSRAPKSSKSAR
jgi:DNA-binding FadR family transcriptional regulator